MLSIDLGSLDTRSPETLLPALGEQKLSPCFSPFVPFLDAVAFLDFTIVSESAKFNLFGVIFCIFLAKFTNFRQLYASSNEYKFDHEDRSN